MTQVVGNHIINLLIIW